MILHQNSLFLIFFFLFQCFDKKQENKHYIHFLSLALYKVTIFNLFGRLNTFYIKQLFMLQYTCFDVFFKVFRSINGISNKTPFYKYNICNLNKEENSA